jgi:hypothetical protein
VRRDAHIPIDQPGGFIGGHAGLWLARKSQRGRKQQQHEHSNPTQNQCKPPKKTAEIVARNEREGKRRKNYRTPAKNRYTIEMYI